VALADPGLAIELSVLLLEVGDAEGAKERLELALRDDPSSAEGWHVLGLAGEALGEDELRSRAWLEARRLDLEEDAASPAKEREGLDDEALEKIAESVLGELSEELRAKLGNVPVVVAELPAADDVQSGLDPRTLAIFEGTPLSERASGAPAETTRIVLFRANLGRIAPDPEVLEEEIRTTLMHEVGHFLGLDEEALEKAGLA
jgi:predicted Zn-dependent protease with MMP-like domain